MRLSFIFSVILFLISEILQASFLEGLDSHHNPSPQEPPRVIIKKQDEEYLQALALDQKNEANDAQEQFYAEWLASTEKQFQEWEKDLGDVETQIHLYQQEEEKLKAKQTDDYGVYTKRLNYLQTGVCQNFCA